MLRMKNNINNVIGWIAAIVVVFAMCSPVTGTVIGMFIMSQKASSLISVLIGVLVGVIISCYAPIIYNYFKEILKLLLR